jgi:hypothetical protein
MPRFAKVLQRSKTLFETTVGTRPEPCGKNRAGPSGAESRGARVSRPACRCLILVVQPGRHRLRTASRGEGIALCAPAGDFFPTRHDLSRAHLIDIGGHRGESDVTFLCKTFCVTRERGEDGARNDYVLWPAFGGHRD